MCASAVNRCLAILRHNMSKCEYVQDFFTTKKIWPNPSGSYYWRGKLASWPSGNRALKEGGKQNLKIWWASRRSWIQFPYTYLNSPTGITSKQKLRSLLCARSGPSRQWPTKSKQKKKNTERRKENQNTDPDT